MSVLIGYFDSIVISSPASKIPSEFSKFMKCGKNKTRLIDLICEVIPTDYKKALKMLKCKGIYYSTEDVALYLTKMISTLLLFKSNQEEADKKVILYCLDALKEPELTVVLRSPSGQTDIMVLAVSLISSSQDWVFIDY